MEITMVNVQNPKHYRVHHSWGYGHRDRQGHLGLGDVSLIVTAQSHAEAEDSALALEAVAAHAQALADEVRAVQQAMEQAASDGALDNADAELDAAGADDYLTEVPF